MVSCCSLFEKPQFYKDQNHQLLKCRYAQEIWGARDRLFGMKFANSSTVTQLVRDVSRGVRKLQVVQLLHAMAFFVLWQVWIDRNAKFASTSGSTEQAIRCINRSVETIEFLIDG